MTTISVTITTMPTKTISAILEDGEGNTSEIEISYDWEHYHGWKPEIVVTGYEWQWIGEALNIPKGDLMRDIEELIEKEEIVPVSYNI